jgi:hypothetical protein
MARIRNPRFVRIVTGLLLAITFATATPSHKSVAAKGTTPLAELQEVKLRKLHLVRPDLIMYPIAYEVFC